MGPLGTYNSDKEPKLRTETQIIKKQEFWVKNPTFSSLESGMFFMDPKVHIWNWGTYNVDTELKLETRDSH